MSEAKSVTATFGKTVTAPGAPNLSAANALNNKISLVFTAPSNGGAAITGYRARCLEGETILIAQGTTSPLTVTGLTNGKTYSCSVAAENSVGVGQYSNVLVATPAGVSVSGTVLIDGLLQIDGDTNDPLIPAAQITLNGTPETAQLLYAPFVLAGHVNAPSAGPARGRWYTTGDSFDYFFAQLKKDQVITLKVDAKTQAAGDLILYLYDSSGVLRNQIAPYSRLQTATVPTTGSYWILVRAFTGASKYILDASEIPVPAASVASVEFIPGQGVVTFEGRELSVSAEGPTRRVAPPIMELFTETAVIRDDGDNDGVVLIDQLSVADVLSQDGGSELPFGTFPDRKTRESYLTVMGLRMLAADPTIATAEPNYLYRQQAVPTDPNYTQQSWHYEQIGLPSAWNFTRGSSDVVVAVIDSGVAAHSDLVSNLLPGYDFVSSDFYGDGNGRDSDAGDPGTYKLYPNSNIIIPGEPRRSHGTHVAGTIAAIWGNGQFGVGAAPNAKVLPVRVLNAFGGQGDLVDIAEGIKFAAGLIPGNQPVRKADVINLSLSGQMGCPSIYQQAIDAARSAGAIVVAASGNDSNPIGKPVGAPANCNGVVAVGATNRFKTRSSYSNYGMTLDVVAPGGFGNGTPSEDIFSTDIEYVPTSFVGRSLPGTSMASPHVAGVAALMKSVRPSLTPTEFDQALEGGLLTIDLGPAGWDQEYGRGLISAPKAVSWAQGGSSGAITARIDAAPRSISVGAATNEFDVFVYLVGESGSTVFVTPTPKVAWLTVLSAQIVDSRTLRYRVAINRALLADGFHDGGITFSASVGPSVTVSISTIKRSVSVLGRSGYNYGALIDSKTNVQLKNVAGVVSGTTAFNFADVAAGEYLFVFGGDTDGDGFFCGVGESCGYYGDLERGPVGVAVDGALTGLLIVMSLIDIGGAGQQAASSGAETDTSRSSSPQDENAGQPLIDPSYDVLGIKRVSSAESQALMSLGVIAGTNAIQGSVVATTRNPPADAPPTPETDPASTPSAVTQDKAYAEITRRPAAGSTVRIEGPRADAAAVTGASLPSAATTDSGGDIDSATDPLSGSMYRVIRANSGIAARQHDSWVLEYLSHSGERIASKRLPDSAVVQWRRTDGRGVPLAANAWTEVCGGKVWVVQDGYQFVASAADLTLNELRSAEIPLTQSAVVNLVSDVRCSASGEVQVRGYMFGVSDAEPLLSIESRPAKKFEVLINRAGGVLRRELGETKFSTLDICMSPASELREFCADSASQLR
jgi:serine protease